MIVKVVLQGALYLSRHLCHGFWLAGLMFQYLLRPGASGLDYGLWCRLSAQVPHRGDSCNNHND